MMNMDSFIILQKLMIGIEEYDYEDVINDLLANNLSKNRYRKVEISSKSRYI